MVNPGNIEQIRIIKQKHRVINLFTVIVSSFRFHFVNKHSDTFTVI